METCTLNPVSSVVLYMFAWHYYQVGANSLIHSLGSTVSFYCSVLGRKKLAKYVYYVCVVEPLYKYSYWYTECSQGMALCAQQHKVVVVRIGEKKSDLSITAGS